MCGGQYPPSAPGSLTASWARPRRATWTAATDSIGVTAYDVHRNGIYLGRWAERDHLHRQDGDRRHRIHLPVAARDLAGNTTRASVNVDGGSPTPPHRPPRPASPRPPPRRPRPPVLDRSPTTWASRRHGLARHDGRRHPPRQRHHLQRHRADTGHRVHLQGHRHRRGGRRAPPATRRPSPPRRTPPRPARPARRPPPA